jgi:hypothetical protein
MFDNFTAAEKVFHPSLFYLILFLFYWRLSKLKTVLLR